jgi:excisionase family DNA binding protein
MRDTYIPLPTLEMQRWMALMIDGIAAPTGADAIMTTLFEIKDAPRALKGSAPAPKPPESYDLAGAAAFLGMTQRKVRELVKARRIACTRIDYRHFLFMQADLDEFLAAYRTKPKRI